MLKSLMQKLFDNHVRCFTWLIRIHSTVFMAIAASMFLDVEELVKLTGRKRRRSQVQALKFMGIEHRIRPDGSVAVSRVHVEQLLGVVCDGGSRQRGGDEAEPNWAMI